PTRVSTERLWSGSVWTSSRSPPAASAMAATAVRSRPSLMLTTHSSTASPAGSRSPETERYSGVREPEHAGAVDHPVGGPGALRRRQASEARALDGPGPERV